MSLEASEISIVAENSNEISVVIDCAQPVEATVEVGGPPGASAFDVWLQQPGNAGKTEADFFESLRGPQGETGDVGPAGQDATGLGGYPVAFSDLSHGDLLEFGSSNAWVNVRRHELTDGGNF